MTSFFKMNEQIVEGREIISTLLKSVPEWSNTSFHREDDWGHIEELQFLDDFTNEVLKEVNDLYAHRSIVKKLLERTVQGFERLIDGWNEKELSEVPSIVEGIAKAKQWLAQQPSA